MVQRTVAGAALFVCSIAAYSIDPTAALQNYAESVAASSESGAIKVASVKRTMTDPFVAYLVVFKTSHKALMSSPNADKDSKAFRANLVRTRAWEAKFCTPKLRALMAEIGAAMVTGDLQDIAGDTQSMAPCVRGS